VDSRKTDLDVKTQHREPWM